MIIKEKPWNIAVALFSISRFLETLETSFLKDLTVETIELAIHALDNLAESWEFNHLFSRKSHFNYLQLLKITLLS